MLTFWVRSFFTGWLLILFIVPLSAQEDFSWWNQLVDWDGVTTWERYLTIAPASMGPNALPVPSFLTGRMDTTAYFQLGGVYHHHTGDPTENLTLDLFTPLFSNRVGIAFYWVPLEHFDFTDAVRDERSARRLVGEGLTTGDVHISTLIQLLAPRGRGVEALLRISLRTASGNDLGATRYTDSPGYSFDLTFGQDFQINNGRSVLRPYFMGGFYVWQTYTVQTLQNDAISFAAGLEWRLPKWTLNAGFGGYAGYLDNGDRPLVSRLSVLTNRPGRLQYRVGWQHGWHDFDFTSFSFGGRYLLGE